MNGLQLILVAAGILMASGVPACFGAGRSNAGQRLSCALMVLGSLVGWFGLVGGLFSSEPAGLSIPWHLPWGRFSVGLDPLSAVFLVPIFTIPALCVVYGLGYWRSSEHSDSGRGLSLFFGVLAGAMALVVVSRDAVLFLMAWEVMALAAFFLVSTEHGDPEVRRAGWIYLVATHTGTLCLIALFGLFRLVSGSFSLSTLAAGSVAPGVAAALFLLTIIGFGLKAGIMPLHAWLPGAHANAPSHVSAVLSGVMLKMGIYGIVRMLMLLPVPGLWSGVLLLGLGTLGGLLGIALALGQSDIKRLLAYSSIENIGLITMGIGLAMMGRALHHAEFVLLGLGSALLHVWNHSLFKSLLFLNAGAIIHAVHTRDINRMGGLARAMPRTAGFFLVGAVAICGLPPLNGFAGEWLLYLGLFKGMHAWHGVPGIIAGGGVVALAMIGALALACFVKVYGVVFLGQPRQACPPVAHEAPRSMRLPMGLLAGCCIGIGLLPWLAIPLLNRAVVAWDAETLLKTPNLESALPPLIALTFAGLALVGAGLLSCFLLFRKIRWDRAPRAITWSCGYARPSARMQYTAASFAQMLTGLFRAVLAPRIREPSIHSVFAEPACFESQQDEPVLDRKILPAIRSIQRFFRRIHRLQRGLTHQYLIYLVLVVVILMVWMLPFETLFKKIFTP